MNLDGPKDRRTWETIEASQVILGETTGFPKDLPIEWVRECARRVRRMRDELHDRWVGLGDLSHWLLAAVIARENVLLIGPPGVAKTEIALRTFDLLGLAQPEGVVRKADRDEMVRPLAPGASPFAWWEDRWARERAQPKYFHYLLSRFTQPEELFGPIEISLLRQGLSVRVNFGLMTGPGVRGVFLDEVFKASSTILNTLLTLTLERRHFNWGGMVPSDIATFIGASNELPGGLATGAYGVGSGPEDFQTLYAFLDRFPIRLMVPPASGSDPGRGMESNLAEATQMAVRREADRMATGRSFPDRADMPHINDILLLGRALLDHERGGPGIFRKGAALADFQTSFFEIASALQAGGTHLEDAAVTWTITPRKLRSLYKIALGHALLRDDGFVSSTHDAVQPPGREDLQVFSHIWDASVSDVVEGLAREVERNVATYATPRR